ncbi:hypothetical protein Vafri_2324 [Volvox africanus]|nr:hypothetical protein Vafri_2324 [Volvox africanus]
MLSLPVSLSRFPPPPSLPPSRKPLLPAPWFFVVFKLQSLRSASRPASAPSTPAPRPQGLAGELASLNQQKVAIQREFDAFREMATAASREHREAAARMLEENATLKTRLAARAFQDVQAGFKPQSKVFSALSGPQTAPSGGGLGFTGGSPLMDPGNSWIQQLPEVLERLERHRRGLVPTLALCGMVVLLVLAAVIRAAAVTRSEHSGGLCFLAHLGINVGPGCGPKHTHSVAEAAVEELGHLLDQAPRVHDVESVAEAAATTEESTAASSAVANGKAWSGTSAAEGLAAGSSAAGSKGREGAAGDELAGKAASEKATDAATGLLQLGGPLQVEQKTAGTGQASGQSSAGLQAVIGTTTYVSESQQTEATAGTAAKVETEMAVVIDADLKMARSRQLRLLQEQLPGKEGRAGLEGRQRLAWRRSRRVLRSAAAMAEQNAR